MFPEKRASWAEESALKPLRTDKAADEHVRLAAQPVDGKGVRKEAVQRLDHPGQVGDRFPGVCGMSRISSTTPRQHDYCPHHHLVFSDRAISIGMHTALTCLCRAEVQVVFQEVLLRQRSE